MNILILRTDKPQAEVGLYKDEEKQKYISWQADRQLSITIHKKIEELLEGAKPEGIVVYGGPGSFTGLRIGISVANALAYSLDIPIVAVGGPDWIENAIKKLASGVN